MRIVVRAGLVSAVAMLGLFAAGLPAAADTPTECDGVIGAETVTTPITVPDGAVCDLEGTTVIGPVTVGENADLYAYQASLHSGVTGEADAFIDLLESTVVGAVQLEDGEGVMVDGGSILGGFNATDSAFAYVLDAAVNGNVNAQDTGEILAYNGQIMGQFNGEGGQVADVVDSGVVGNVNIGHNTDGSFFCGSQVVGLTSFDGNELGIQVGGGDLFGDCEPNRFLSSVSFTDNQAEIQIVDNTIQGFLDCYDNDPAPTGEGNTIHGFARGQCEPMSPFVSADQPMAEAEDGERYQGFNLVEERRAAADKLDRSEQGTTISLQ